MANMGQFQYIGVSSKVNRERFKDFSWGGRPYKVALPFSGPSSAFTRYITIGGQEYKVLRKHDYGKNA